MVSNSAVRNDDEWTHVCPSRQVVVLCRLSKNTIRHLCFGPTIRL